MAEIIIYTLTSNYIFETRLLLRLRICMCLHEETEHPLIATGKHEFGYGGELQNLTKERQILRECNANDRNHMATRYGYKATINLISQARIRSAFE